MTLSKTTEYALRILTFMVSDTDKMYSSVHLYDKLKIPKKYLQKLLTDLSKNGLIKSIQGRNGGFIIAKKTDKIFISDIIEAVEGFNKEPSCFFGFQKCSLEQPCSMHNVWTQAHHDIIEVLSTTKLSELKNKRLTD